MVIQAETGSKDSGAGSKEVGEIKKYAMDEAYKEYKNKKATFLYYWKTHNAASAGLAIKSVTVDSKSRKTRYEISQSAYDKYTDFPHPRPFVSWGFGEGSPHNRVARVSYAYDSWDYDAGHGLYYVEVANSVVGKSIKKAPSAARIVMIGAGPESDLLAKSAKRMYAAYTTYLAQKKIYDDWTKKYAPVTPLPKGGSGSGGGTKKDKTTTDYIYAYNDSSLKYNLGAVNFQYFRDYPEAIDEKGNPAIQSFPGGNAPTWRIQNAQEAFSTTSQATASVKHKKDKKHKKAWYSNETYNSLNGTGYGNRWSREVPEHASKGVIQSMTNARRLDRKNTSGGATLTPEQATKIGKEINEYRMGFQFHYNPSNFTLQWQGSPNVDIATVMSGADKFGPIGAGSGTGSGFSISVPLNRMADMQFVGMDESDWTTIPWDRVYGISLKEQVQSEKLSQSPTFDDLRKIRDLGTMYDVEFLLQTILGYKLKSGIRLGRHQMTPDLGYLGGAPVEVHLGKNMRYYASVTSISVYHSIFTKDMVPMISSLTINCSRIPDYTPAARNS